MFSNKFKSSFLLQLAHKRIQNPAAVEFRARGRPRLRFRAYVTHPVSQNTPSPESSLNPLRCLPNFVREELIDHAFSHCLICNLLILPFSMLSAQASQPNLQDQISTYAATEAGLIHPMGTTSSVSLASQLGANASLAHTQQRMVAGQPRCYSQQSALTAAG